MCKDGRSCFCHFLKPAIENDYKKKFLQFFKNQRVIELYSFLRDAYELEAETNELYFMQNFAVLMEKYIQEEGDQPINISGQDKVFFLDKKDKLLENEVSMPEVKKQLTSTLIPKVEKLTYSNLGSVPGFSEYIKQYDPSSDRIEDFDPTEKKKKVKAASCVGCVIL